VPLTARVFPAFGARDETFALGLFRGGLPRSSDGLRFLAGPALGRFFIGLATPHLAKNALPLHLLLQGPESLIDIVVANEYLQMFSNRAAVVAVGDRDAVSDSSRLTDLQIVRRLIAAVADHFIVEHLTLVERP
jgi:hypothetical protein